MPGHRDREANRAAWAERPDLGRPHFSEGNTAAVKHGAKSMNIVAPLVNSLVDEIVEAVPVLGEPRYRRATLAWATAESRLDRIRPYVDALPLDEMSAERGPSAYALRLEALADRLRRELALTIASAATIGKSDLGRTVDASKARAMITALHADIVAVVKSGKLDELETAAEARE